MPLYPLIVVHLHTCNVVVVYSCRVISMFSKFQNVLVHSVLIAIHDCIVTANQYVLIWSSVSTMYSYVSPRLAYWNVFSYKVI